MSIDPAALRASIARLEQDQSAGAADPADLLHRVLESAQGLFALSGLGLMFLDEDEALRHIAATDSAAHALERAQEELAGGPCVDSLARNEVVTCADLTLDHRYRAVGDVVAAHGVRAVLGVPVRMDGAAVGTLNVHRDRPHPWTTTRSPPCARSPGSSRRCCARCSTRSGTGGWPSS